MGQKSIMNNLNQSIMNNLNKSIMNNPSESNIGIYVDILIKTIIIFSNYLNTAQSIINNLVKLLYYHEKINNFACKNRCFIYYKTLNFFKDNLFNILYVYCFLFIININYNTKPLIFFITVFLFFILSLLAYIYINYIYISLKKKNVFIYYIINSILIIIIYISFIILILLIYKLCLVLISYVTNMLPVPNIPPGGPARGPGTGAGNPIGSGGGGPSDPGGGGPPCSKLPPIGSKREGKEGVYRIPELDEETSVDTSEPVEVVYTAPIPRRKPKINVANDPSDFKVHKSKMTPAEIYARKTKSKRLTVLADEELRKASRQANLEASLESTRNLFDTPKEESFKSSSKDI